MICMRMRIKKTNMKPRLLGQRAAFVTAGFDDL